MMIDIQKNRDEQLEVNCFFKISAQEFRKVPGSPIAYWISDSETSSFAGKYIEDVLDIRAGLLSGKDDFFIRDWFEISYLKIPFSIDSDDVMRDLNPSWLPVTGGGNFRKWYGNLLSIVKSKDDFFAIKNLPGNNYRLRDSSLYFKEAINWPMISSECFGAKISPKCVIMGNGVRTGFLSNEANASIWFFVSYLSSKVASNFLKIINPTLNFNNENIAVIPFNLEHSDRIEVAGKSLVLMAKSDWDSVEISWDFTTFPMLSANHFQRNVKGSYQSLRVYWREMTQDMQRLEQENNRIFINAYGLQDQLTPEVPLNEITLTCNPHYRYGGDKTEEELEALLLADTMREFISYAVGCMFGRYALDKPGLVLANQGETIEDYRRLVPNSRFEADADNVIPVLDGEWFADDVTERFRQFLRVTFGDEDYVENLAFIEQALNPKGKRNYTLRDYMLGEFYTDHIKRYKKRPIYWLFSSPKGTFNALIYLHRYRPDTASVVLRYLREFRAKLAARQSTLEQVLINPATSQGEKTKAGKEIDTLKKQIIELQDYENDTLYPLATAQVAIDLDDGVKVNYLKLGAALKKITGLDAKEED
jgi:hypothetical protein